MKYYSIHYKLNREGQDYTSLYDAIDTLGKSQKLTTSTRFIRSGKSLDFIYKLLVKKIDNNDRLVVIEIDPNNVKLFGATNSLKTWFPQ